jgi:hypothetical protein
MEKFPKQITIKLDPEHMDKFHQLIGVIYLQFNSEENYHKMNKHATMETMIDLIWQMQVNETEWGRRFEYLEEQRRKERKIGFEV